MVNPTEIYVHVFFVDTVALSDPRRGSTEDQIEKLDALFRFITNSPVLKKRLNSVLVSHTGDGVAICFKDGPRTPLELALDLHKNLGKYNKKKIKNKKIEVRIGINSGMIFPMIGVAKRGNYWGRGINHARRIMDCGDKNHILITASTAQELREISNQYKRSIRYMGDITIKHGETIPVYSAYGKGFGNKLKPKSIKVAQTKDIEKSGRLILEALKKNEINSTSLLQLFKKREQSKFQLDSKKKKRRRKN